MKECIFEPQSIFVKNYEKLNSCVLIETDDIMFMSMDAAVGYLIPKSKWILGKLKFAPSTLKLYYIIGNESDYVDGKIIGTIPGGKGKDLIVIESNNQKVYMDKKLFDKSFPKNVSLKVKSAKTPIRVYDEFALNLIGVIMPVNHKEG